MVVVLGVIVTVVEGGRVVLVVGGTVVVVVMGGRVVLVMGRIAVVGVTVLVGMVVAEGATGMLDGVVLAGPTVDVVVVTRVVVVGRVVVSSVSGRWASDGEAWQDPSTRTVKAKVAAHILRMDPSVDRSSSQITTGWHGHVPWWR